VLIGETDRSLLNLSEPSLPALCECGQLQISSQDHHFAQRYEWDDVLSREAKRATRTGTRGQGGAKQDDELDIDQAFNLRLSDAPLGQDGPCAPTRLLEIGPSHVL